MLGIVFFGVGFLLYLVLWVISPQANTLTEKMEMQGRPITLSNIESSIKQNLNINEAPNQESTLTRILLFPFRAIATIISGLGGAFGPSPLGGGRGGGLDGDLLEPGHQGDEPGEAGEESGDDEYGVHLCAPDARPADATTGWLIVRVPGTGPGKRGR